jgi:hypothetical protein
MDEVFGTRKALDESTEAVHRWEQALTIFDSLARPRAANGRERLAT